ncbi:MAG: efflux RND transporter periplasmic adaptor subunit [Pseudomonadota bacterium]
MTFRTPSFAVLLALIALSFPGANVAAQTPVVVATPKVAPAVEQLTLSGSFVPRRQAALSPQVAGLVAAANFEPGDRVTRGTVLVRLDARVAELELAQAEAEVARAEAALREARRLVEEAEALRADRLFPETELRARESGAEIAAAALAVARAARDTSARRRQLHNVTAPFDGVIARRLVDSGEWVNQGIAVARLVAPDDLWMEVQAPQSLWPQLSRLESAVVTVDALSNRRFAATLEAAVPQSDPGARTFLVRLRLTEAIADLTPGMSATADLTLASTEETLLIPRDALIRYPDGTTTVFVVDGGTPPTARQLSVDVDRVYGETAVIAGGLDSLLPVVTRGNEALTDGQAVRVIDGAGD